MQPKKQVVVDFTANEQTPERAIRNCTKKVNEYLEKNPGARVVSLSHSITGMANLSPKDTDRLQVQIIAVFELA